MPAPTVTPQPAPAAQTIGALKMTDSIGPTNSWATKAGRLVTLYVDEIANVDHVTFKIARAKGARPEVLAEADVELLTPSAAGAMVFWKAEAGTSTVWLSAVGRDGAGHTVSTKAYPLSIAQEPAPEIGTITIAPFEHSARFPNDPAAQQVRAGSTYNLLITGIQHATMLELAVENVDDSRNGYESIGKVAVADDGSARITWTVPEHGLASAMLRVTASNAAGDYAEKSTFVAVEPAAR